LHKARLFHRKCTHCISSLLMVRQNFARIGSASVSIKMKRALVHI
jgi:hypothetical protein